MIEKTVWVAYTNSDLTEGRGRPIPHAVCELKITAERLAKKIGPMGSDGEVRESSVLEHEGRLYVPYELARITTPSAEDLKRQAALTAHEEAVKKALGAGLTQADIDALARR